MKAILKKILPYLQRFLTFLETKITKSTLEIDSPIHNLAPKTITDKQDLEKISPYLNSLKQAIDEDCINNIAITGSYGSGKSTILRTFQNIYRNNYEFLNISLASFNVNNLSPDSPSTETIERRLEISILQQMFYHVKPSVIPDSRFKRIVNISTTEFYKNAIFIIFWLLSVLLLFKFDYINSANPHSWQTNHKLDYFSIISIIIFFFGIGYVIKSAIHFLSNSKISKINIKGELELGESIDKSVFNQHLEEILYFFEKTKFNVVVIEDVDRFNSSEIFTKLREINILINNSNLIKRQVNFVYAIKDEMFKDKNERVKFFEFIIPIISFINPSNASEQLTKLITQANLKGVLSDEFTSDIVTFIDDIDMRLLINIFQEYQIYKGILSQDLKQDNLFAIIVYKNMFPEDFGELPKRRGKLYKILSSKSEFIKELKNKLLSELETIDNEISLIKNQNNISINELRIIFINIFASKIEKFVMFKIDEIEVTINDAIQDEYFNKIRLNDAKYIAYRTMYNNLLTQNLKIDFSVVEDENNLTYEKREKRLIDRENNLINNYKSEKDRINQTIIELESLSLQEIFEKVGITQYLSDFSDSLLIRNLLLNGYIDENYDDYISLFHEINLTKDDFAFERKVKSGINSDYNYLLTKTESLIKRLSEKYFRREAILNYNILTFLIENHPKYSQKNINFYTLVSKDDEIQLNFILGYIQSKPTQLSKFIEDLCHYKPTFWEQISTNQELTESEIREIVLLIFNYANTDSILKFTQISTLVKYITEINDFFEFCSLLNNTKSIEHFIDQKQIKIVQLDFPNSQQENLRGFIFDKYFYILNEHNVDIQIKLYAPEYVDSLKSAHYTTILKSGLKNLINRISGNINLYPG